MQFWNELEGQTIAGRYPLLRLVLTEGRTAWFATRTPEGPAVIGLTEALTDADDVTERLKAGQRLHHPNLVKILEVGRTAMGPAEDRTTFVYALMEHSDQNLADVLRDQALSRDDLRELADALVGALTELHHHGLVHGRVEPRSVVAAGETVKLRSDCLQAAGGSRSADVSGLGATLFQAFFRSRATSPDDPQINRAPAPFAEIIRNSLSGRWTLAQVAMALKPPANAIPAASVTMAETGQTAGKSVIPAPSPTEPPAAEPPSQEKKQPIAAAAPIGAGGAAKAVPDLAPTSPPVRDPVMPAVLAAPLRANLPEEGMGPRKARVALVAGVAGVLLLIVIWILARPASQRANRTPSAASAPLPTSNPKVITRNAAPAPSRAAAPTDTPGDVWRVVVYTFDRQAPAERRAEEIRLKHGNLQAAVLTVPGPRPRYLIVIGGAMTRPQAMKLRSRAPAMGFPADCYVQNFQTKPR